MRAEIEARSHKPDLLLVDLGLPDGDGLKVIRKVRAWSPVPVIVLSARTMEDQKIAALDAGCRRLRNETLQRPRTARPSAGGVTPHVRSADQSSVLHLSDIKVDLERRETHGPHGEIHLTPLEYRVLESLARHLGSIVVQINWYAKCGDRSG